MGKRTDLAAETVKELGDSLPEGLCLTKKLLSKRVMTMLEVTSQQGEDAIGKPQGIYVTIEGNPFWEDQGDCPEDMEAVAAGIRFLLPEEGLVLVVGLGNREITPDALGPQTAEHILATRHLSSELCAQTGLEHLRKTAVLAPNVLGKTGLESLETIQAVVDKIKPAAIVAVDALAAGELERLGRTIQISNTGICPGSGVLNARKELSEQMLGIPVVAIGVPTVVDLSSYLSDEKGEAMMITPREIDLLIERAVRFLSLCINRALQPTLSLQELTLLQS